ncbi:hypothetical protein F511_29949 [Dorcoceras hygrometricum]|uniref:Uncharacterized protein n=1 Tax=Dorcoceras hygrometricum TaxID=472368 RepID=A0A2Z7DBP8_9LAMI|nr:hypothetical protein F511_29949 [Dorcoceras hygrometricum]
MSASGESSTTMHRLLHASGSHPIPTPYDPRTNQYNQDLGLIHSTNGNHLESPKEGSSIDHQITIYLHAQNITMFPTNETWYFASQILVSNSGGLILILTAQSTRNTFRPPYLAPPPSPPRIPRSPPLAVAPPPLLRDRTCSDHLEEESPFVPNSSGLLLQADEGILLPVVDLIKEFLPSSTVKSQIPCEFGWSQAPRRQQGVVELIYDRWLH